MHHNANDPNVLGSIEKSFILQQIPADMLKKSCPEAVEYLKQLASDAQASKHPYGYSPKKQASYIRMIKMQCYADELIIEPVYLISTGAKTYEEHDPQYAPEDYRKEERLIWQSYNHVLVDGRVIEIVLDYDKEPALGHKPISEGMLNQIAINTKTLRSFIEVSEALDREAGEATTKTCRLMSQA